MAFWKINMFPIEQREKTGCFEDKLDLRDSLIYKLDLIISESFALRGLQY